MNRVATILVLFAALALAGCSIGDNNPLTGCYGAKQGAEPRVLVEAIDKKFFMKLFKDGQWSDGYPLHEGSEEELDKYFGKNARHIKTSLIADQGSLALFKVDPGPLDKSSKYQAVLLLLAGDVYKVPCD